MRLLWQIPEAGHSLNHTPQKIYRISQSLLRTSLLQIRLLPCYKSVGTLTQVLRQLAALH